MNAKSDAEADEDRRRAEPPAAREAPGERHHDHEREADEEELGAELEPVREQRLDVAAVGLVVAPVPPHLGQPERHLRDPDEREPDHPEQHPRADPAGRRLAREADAPARVGEQHADQHELGDDELDPEEASRSGRRARSPAGRSVRARSTVRQLEAARDLGSARATMRRPPRGRRGRARRAPEPPGACSSDAAPGQSLERRARARAAGGGRSAGLACGYASVSEEPVRVRLRRGSGSQTAPRFAKPVGIRPVGERREPAEEADDEQGTR